ncbi:MAG: Aminodeoxychorismate synthase [Flavipsychrobacter sp.]|nr:Aminodeoxychorismate synthase [Flavipsychrobacter sp.]
MYALTGAQAKEIKQRMLNWANQFSILLFLDSNNYPSIYNGYECLLAAGATSVIKGDSNDLLLQVQQLHEAKPDWLFGHIAYDYKNILEPKLSSAHKARIGFPALQFFVPQTVCHVNREQTFLTIESFEDTTQIYNAIIEAEIESVQKRIPALQFNSATSKEEYLQTINNLRRHIADGDCYEINYCTEGYCEDVSINPMQVFNALNVLSPAPFAAYYRTDDQHMMCASPERYLRKEGVGVLSQPIKGTARRDKDPVKDAEIKQQLSNDIKERAENVMIVDLMRNDLARCCETGSIKVDELFGIYSFPQVHQMISTVSGTMRAGVPFTDAIRHSFPMGSMTGAPKYKVMQLIEQYEHSRRELFAGTVGYITPAGDFDLNVVIRSLFYNAESRHLAYQTGGAITWDSNPEQEWEEMRLKAWALERIFS